MANRISLALLLLLFAAPEVNAESLKLTGQDLTPTHPQFAERMNIIWNYTSTKLALLSANAPAPEVAIEPFTRAKQSAEWTSWQNEWIVRSAHVWLEWVDVKGVPKDQITEVWVREHLSTLYPFPPQFRGFHYENHAKIQMNPDSTFRAYMNEDPFGGGKKDFVGYGYYSSGHEMTHEALHQRGIPEKLHHCIFVAPIGEHLGLMERLADFLIDQGIAGMTVKLFGLSAEVGFEPCKRLNDADRELALKYAAELAGEPVVKSTTILK